MMILDFNAVIWHRPIWPNKRTKWASDIRSYSFDCFFRILSCIKMKLGQILVQLMTTRNETWSYILVELMTTIFNWSLPLVWRLETSSRFFFDFEKIASINFQLIMFNNFNPLSAHFQKSKIPQLFRVGFWPITVGW